jgi:hypothetical protein
LRLANNTMIAALLRHTERCRCRPIRNFYCTRWILARIRFATAADFPCCSPATKCASASLTSLLSGASAAADRKSSCVRTTPPTNQGRRAGSRRRVFHGEKTPPLLRAQKSTWPLATGGFCRLGARRSHSALQCRRRDNDLLTRISYIEMTMAHNAAPITTITRIVLSILATPRINSPTITPRG